MSQYLSHLAALTLHQLEPVQPRLASRFETPIAGGATYNIDVDIIRENPPSMPDQPVQPSPITAISNPEQLMLIQPHLTSRVETPIEQAVIPASAVAPLSKADYRPDIQPTEMGFKSPEFSVEQPKKQPDKNMTVDIAQSIPLVQVVNEAVAFAVPQNTRPTEHGRNRVERVQEHFTKTTHNELVIREVMQPAPPQTMIKPEVSAVKPVSIKPWTEPATAPRQSVARQISADPSAGDATPAPTIQVTIGRIEIRATQTLQKPAEKPRLVSNKLSLDDYLKQRNEGKA